MSVQSLWPEDLEVKAPISVATLLRQQAAALGQRMQNIVTANVETQPHRDSKEVEHRFYLHAPIINFSYLLFTTTYALDKPHSIQIATELPQLSGRVDNEEQLQNKLRQIFGHEKTKQVIAQMRELSTTESA